MRLRIGLGFVLVAMLVAAGAWIHFFRAPPPKIVMATGTSTDWRKRANYLLSRRVPASVAAPLLMLRQHINGLHERLRR